jgi:hypothetical protein
MADDDDWSAEDGENEMDDVKAERHIFFNPENKHHINLMFVYWQ